MYSLNLTSFHPIIGTSVILHNIDDYKLKWQHVYINKWTRYKQIRSMFFQFQYGFI